MNLLRRITHKLPYALFLVLAFLLLQNRVDAATPLQPPTTPSQTSSGICGNPNLLSNNLLAPQALSGNLYAKLPSTESSMAVYLYSQPIFGNTCTFLGSAVVQPNTWTYIGQINDNAQASTIIAEGSNLEAGPYEADLDLLNIPAPSPCTIKGDSCLANYGGYEGSLQPNVISTDTSQVTLFVAQPINKTAITSVNYYADGNFIYSSKNLSPVNRKYLDGGKHSVQIQVNFTRGETFSINRSINMGTDWTGTLLLRSIFYRSSNKIDFFVTIGAIILAIIIVLALARYIYKRREYKKEHGLSKKNLEPKKPSDDDPEPPVFIG
jgi:hypothetical protein